MGRRYDELVQESTHYMSVEYRTPADLAIAQTWATLALADAMHRVALMLGAD